MKRWYTKPVFSWLDILAIAVIAQIIEWIIR